MNTSNCTVCVGGGKGGRNPQIIKPTDICEASTGAKSPGYEMVWMQVLLPRASGQPVTGLWPFLCKYVTSGDGHQEQPPSPAVLQDSQMPPPTQVPERP